MYHHLSSYIILHHPFIFIHDFHSFIISIFTPQNVEEILHEIHPTSRCAEHLSGATCDEGRPLEELRKDLPWAQGNHGRRLWVVGLCGGEGFQVTGFFWVQFWGMMILVEMFLDWICEILKSTFLEKGKELERDDSLQTTYHPWSMPPLFYAILKISSCIAGPKFPGWKGFSELSENWWTEKRPEEALRVAAFLRFLQELFAKKTCAKQPNVPTKTKRGAAFPLVTMERSWRMILLPLIFVGMIFHPF